MFSFHWCKKKKKKNPKKGLYLDFRLCCPSCCQCFSASASVRHLIVQHLEKRHCCISQS